jgi:hypothetical protein
MSTERARLTTASIGNLGLHAASRVQRILACGSRAWLIGLTMMTAADTAKATTWTYAWERGSSFSFADGVSAAPSGALTIDPTSGQLKSAVDIVLTGSGPEAGTYGPSYCDLGETLVYTDGPANLSLFLTDLDAGPNKVSLSEVSWYQPNSPQTEASEVAGGLQTEDSIARAVPEPSTWALFSPGLAGLALRRGRRRDRLRARLLAETA